MTGTRNKPGQSGPSQGGQSQGGPSQGRSGQGSSGTLPWPPVIFVCAAALAVALHRFVPLPWLSAGPLPEFLFAVGWLVLAGAAAMMAAAIRALGRAGAGFPPVRIPEHLVTRGPFSFTRNPIYLGGVAILIGLGLIARTPWFIVLAPAAAFAVRKLAIEREEKHLETRFGKKWRDYAKRVRRWV